jgi:hypothetical protein
LRENGNGSRACIIPNVRSLSSDLQVQIGLRSMVTYVTVYLPMQTLRSKLFSCAHTVNVSLGRFLTIDSSLQLHPVPVPVQVQFRKNKKSSLEASRFSEITGKNEPPRKTKSVRTRTASNYDSSPSRPDAQRSSTHHKNMVVI